METHSIVLGLIYEIKTPSILVHRVYVEKDIDRQTDAQHVLRIYLNLHIPVFINFYTFCSQLSAFNL